MKIFKCPFWVVSRPSEGATIAESDDYVNDRLRPKVNVRGLDLQR